MGCKQPLGSLPLGRLVTARYRPVILRCSRGNPEATRLSDRSSEDSRGPARESDRNRVLCRVPYK